MSDTTQNLARRMWFTPARDVVRGRITGRLDWRRAIAEAELPESLAEVATQVVRKARLWRRERLEIAEEIVSHFQEGIDSGASEDELRKSFGDPKTAAKLIRRAKRRCRPWWWQAFGWATRALLIFILLYALMAIWLSFGKPNVATNYLAKLNAPVSKTPVEDRAWPIYLEIERRRFSDRFPDELIEKGIPGSTSEPNFLEIGETETEAWIDDNQWMLEALREAAKKPKFGAPLVLGPQTFDRFDPRTGDVLGDQPSDFRKHNLLSTLLAHVQTTRGYARTLRQDSFYAARQEDGDRALANIEAMVGIADHTKQTPFLVAGLVGIAIDGMAFDTCRTIERNHPELFSDEQLKRLAHRVAAVEYDMSAWLKGERAMFMDIVQRLYTDDGQGDGYVSPAGLRYYQESLAAHFEMNPSVNNPSNDNDSVARELLIDATAPALYFAMASRAEIVARYDEITQQPTAIASTPLWEVSYDQWLGYRDEQSAMGKIQFLPLDLMIPAFQGTNSAVERARGIREGWLIGIALELYRRENGTWPETLDALSPKYLPELPVDRITGEPLLYRIADDKPLVYSRGVDADDDGGVAPRDYREAPWAHNVAPPRPEIDDDGTEEFPDEDDGDWVIWTLAEPVEVEDEDDF